MLTRFVITLALSILFGQYAFSADWSQFLGPNRNGISPETGLLKSWPDGGPRELWRSKASGGLSGIAVASGRVFTMTQHDGRQWATTYSATSGKQLWETDLGLAYDNPQGKGPRATPTIDGSRAYVYTGEGILIALAVESGKELWRRNAVKDNRGKTADYGMACSPIIVGDNVAVTVGSSQATVAAYDKETGEPAWTTGRDPAGYSSPAVLGLAGGKQLVVVNGAAVLGISTSGELLWRYPYATDYQCNTATPIAVDGKLFISAGENHGSVMLAMEGEGKSLSPSEVWSSQGVRSVLRSEWQTPVLLEGYLYGFDNVGSAGPVSHLTCIDAKTGERKWQDVRFGKGNLILADGKLFMTTVKGELVIARADPTAYKELGRAEVCGFTRQAPVIANGKLFLRDEAEIVCFDVNGK